MSKYNNFELLMYAAAEKSSDALAEEFLNIDDSEFAITPSQQKRMNKLAKSYILGRNRKTTILKILAVACLLSVAVGLTACVSIPRVRNAIKAFFVEWYEDYVAIGFGDKDNSEPKYELIEPNTGTSETDITESTSSSDQDSEKDTVVYPTTISKKATLTYLPGEYNMVVDFEDKTYYLVSFMDGTECVFYISQNVINSALHWTNSDSQEVYKTKIHSYDAILVEDTATPNSYTLIWQDNEYEYLIVGIFSNTEELIKVAEGLVLQ